MTLRFVSGTNPFLPQATGQIIGFVRKPEEFRLNEYVQYVETKAVVGVYGVLERDAFVRIEGDAKFAWEDGDARPDGKWNNVRWQWVEFATFRRDYPFMLGWMAQEQAGGGWKPLAVHAEMVASQAMVNRTQRVITLLENPANWSATGNTASANSLNKGAGMWTTASDDPSNPNYEAIRKSLLEAVRRITLGTNSKVKFKDLKLVVSPGLAEQMSTAPEIVNYIRESPSALPQIKGDISNYNMEWGLPERLYSIPLIVEDACVVTTAPKASGTEATQGIDRNFVKQDQSALLISRIGGLDGVYGSPSFSTCQLYHHKGLLRVETFDDNENERTKGHVQENIKEVLAAPASGFLITATAA